jgi:hypothetical protein
MGQYVMSINSQHAKNEWLWPGNGQNIVAKMMASYGETNEKNHKVIQFMTIFWLLKLGWPLKYFGSMKELFDILKVNFFLCKH